MITKFEQYNEGIKHLLVGPSKDEVWKGLGYEKTFETPKEYLNYIVERLVKMDIGYKFRWIYKNSDIFQYFIDSSILYVNEKIINILETIFNLDFVDVLYLIKREVVPNLNLPRIPKDIQSNRLL